ncbi:hypothetical protein EHS25_006380 [Saitozyma podzolica]|uniref:alpha-1,2-Mannosidase n=1 Tax=Saitozyma podzolica TaxID=1890683 RepID=A0A427YRN2_9TREE|nr:hypothetical protein EHS25_006380 [Saitozyma podzolica]
MAYEQPDTPPSRSMPLSKYDPESGLPGLPGASPTRIMRRYVARRGRLIVGLVTIVVVAIYYLDLGPPGRVMRPPSWSQDTGGREELQGLEGIWEDEPPEEPQGTAPRDRPGDPLPRAQTSIGLVPPEKMDQIYYVVPDEPKPAVGAKTLPSEGSFAARWSAPDTWEARPAGTVKKVQWGGFEEGKKWETAPQRQVRMERREAVRRGFAHAWQAYKDHAWGHDEVKPVSRQPSDPFNNWGASIIDTLDTILLMGFNDEYNLCRPHINQLNFHWVNGRDWAEGYVSPNHGTKADQTDDDNDDDDSDASGGSEKERLPLAISRDRTTGLAVFETGIRYLGGMLGAYDLSGDELLVDRAVELAEILSKAFNTDSGLPVGRIDPGSDSLLRLGQVSIAEVGSMTLELVRLSQVTGDRKWFDFAQRAMDYIEQRVIPRGTYEPLIPLWFMPDQALETPMNGVLAFGGLADSYYEYLIKAYKLLGGSSAAEQYSRIYERSIDRARKTIYLDIDVVPGRDLLAIGKLENGRLIPEIEHLTCFAGAMLGLGARLLDRKTDLRDAERFTQSCYWLSAATPTGLQPEVVEFFDMENPAINGGSMYENITLEEGFPHHPFHGRIDVDEEIEAKRVNRDRNDVLRWAGDGTPVEPDDGGRTEEGPVEYYSRLRGSPPGARKVVGRGINRPETIESIFYMFRLTGDRKWQEKGWKMFVSWMEVAKVPGGISSVHDVTRDDYVYSDNMESFAFAETFKYHFLLQSDPDVLSLDDYVLNTEAHPLLTNPDMVPGSSGLWNPIRNQHLGSRGAGTDAQKWVRLGVLDALARPRRPVAQGGGKGMGGGGGRPGVRPQPPMPAVPAGAGVAAAAQKGGGQGEGKAQVKPRPKPKPKEKETEPIELVDLNEEDDY